ncbi:MAG: PaeR7I family type II restriction endonuclease, partial [Desulfovibrionaceae bacterium]
MPRYQKELSEAVSLFWQTRDKQATKQEQTGKSDQGLRGAVTGGAQMDGFIQLIRKVIQEAGIQDDCIYNKKTLLDLPGYFRPTKEWDIVVVKNGTLLAAIELKSQVGPSFGNN